MSDENTPLLMLEISSNQASSDSNNFRRLEISETPTAKKRRWISLGVGYLGNFTLYANESIYWSMLWPYLSQIDPTISETMYGFVVAAYALGAVLTAPIYGFVSGKIRKTKGLMIIGACFRTVFP